VKGILNLLRELLGLFVDDGSFALALLGWTLVAGFGLPQIGLPAGWDAPIFFLGYLAILCENLGRAVTRK
jgi:hypothetical protein